VPFREPMSASRMSQPRSATRRWVRDSDVSVPGNRSGRVRPSITRWCWCGARPTTRSWVRSISGTVTSTVGGGLDGVWVEVLDAVTDGTGGLAVNSLDAGSYVVRYVDPNGGHTSEFHDDAPTLGTAVPVSVVARAATAVLSSLTPI
jgi:hypothetical protein